MPWNQRDYFQFGFLILCIPLQYYLSNYKQSSVSAVKNDLLVFKNYLRGFRENYFSASSLKICWRKILSWFVINILGIQEDNQDESPAVEVFEYRKKHGITSHKASVIHATRPEGLRFRVGQVVQHVYSEYKGVIIEWEFDPEKSKEPVYTVLLDEPPTERDKFQNTARVKQSKLHLLVHTKIASRFLKHYFTTFDGSQYIPQPWLQRLYPQD